MDPRLFQAASSGDVIALRKLLDEDPFVLEKVDASPFLETPLHIATLARNTDFVKQILGLKPSFARELNKDGFTPLHIASATGNVEIVRVLLKHGHGLCFLKDKNGLSPLHYAAIKGRIDVIQELVSHCPEVRQEVTDHGETALHLAVKNNQFDAIKVLVENDEDGELIHSRDKEGNTILDLAVATKQVQLLEFLRSQSKIDKDVIEEVSKEQVEVGTEIFPQATQTANPIVRQSRQKDRSAKDNSIWSEVEAMVPVVASLIATVTYQAGLSPPQTIWKENMKVDSKCVLHGSKNISFFDTKTSCPAIAYYLFMSFNTAGFFAAVFLIFFFHNKSCVQVLLPIALVSMMITYITLSFTMAPNGLSLLLIYLMTLTIFIYCVLAVQLVKKILHGIFGFAARKVGIMANAVVNRKKQQTDFSNVDA